MDMNTAASFYFGRNHCVFFDTGYFNLVIAGKLLDQTKRGPKWKNTLDLGSLT